MANDNKEKFLLKRWHYIFWWPRGNSLKWTKNKKAQLCVKVWLNSFGVYCAVYVCVCVWCMVLRLSKSWMFLVWYYYDYFILRWCCFCAVFSVGFFVKRNGQNNVDIYINSVTKEIGLFSLHLLLLLLSFTFIAIFFTQN